MTIQEYIKEANEAPVVGLIAAGAALAASIDEVDVEATAQEFLDTFEDKLDEVFRALGIE